VAGIASVVEPSLCKSYPGHASFRIGDNENRKEDDLLDTFCYGIALALGDRLLKIWEIESASWIP
jgi:hypothetical protein